MTTKINDHNIDPVDVRSSDVQKIIAFKGAKFSDSELTTLNAEYLSPCDIKTAFQALTNPPTQTWSKLTVHGNISILDDESHLYDIFENVVLLNKKNIIKAAVNHFIYTIYNYFHP